MFMLNTAFVVTGQKKSESNHRVLTEEKIYEIEAWLNILLRNPSDIFDRMPQFQVLTFKFTLFPKGNLNRVNAKSYRDSGNAA
jgi:hypothetical protein